MFGFQVLPRSVDATSRMDVLVARKGCREQVPKGPGLISRHDSAR